MVDTSDVYWNADFQRNEMGQLTELAPLISCFNWGTPPMFILSLSTINIDMPYNMSICMGGNEIL